MDKERPSLSYNNVGVKTTNIASGMEGLIEQVRKTFEIRPAALDIGYYASVIDIGGGQGIAISTDGVGTKILVAELCEKFDTVGIDCVAMNVNDIICVGARPLSMVDYIAVQEVKADMLSAIARGLYEGAKMAGINIPGGELAQLREMVAGVRPGYGFDLVGTCVGTVPMDKIIVGEDVRPGDVVVGIAASGIHSNGLTLARRVLLERLGFHVDSLVPEFGRTVGEELLEPTAIYVNEAMAMLDAGLRVKAFAHITSDGLLNLTRVNSEVGYRITDVPDIPAVFSVIADSGQVSPAEMWQVFNMGIGFCVVVEAADADAVLNIAKREKQAWVIGTATKDPQKQVFIEPVGLAGTLKSHFQPVG